MNAPEHPAVNLFWKSPLAAVDVLDGARLGVKLNFVETAPDVQVLDVRAFDHFDHLLSTRQTIDAPALIVVQQRKEMLAAIEQTDVHDDICYADDFEAAAHHHLMRLVNRQQPVVCQLPETRSGVDPLTGLATRTTAEATFNQWLKATDAAHPLTTIILDLDHFKRWNDDLGHTAGDRVLAAIGALLRRHAGDRIYCARWGGEEFLILLKAGLQEALDFAELLRTEIKKIEFDFPGQPDRRYSHITASCGVATTFGSTDYLKALEQADSNLYQAKMAGRDKVIGAILDEGGTDGTDHRDDRIIRDFENRIRVTADRLVEYLTIRGRRLADHYREEANRDGLTGLFNHRYFERRITREMANARKDDRPLSLLFLDIDNFGEVNRKYGYPTGDEALRYVVGVMNDSVRSVDWVARYGGEEFCVVMPVTPLEEAAIVGERVRQRIAQGKVTTYDGNILKLTASIGLAQLNSNDEMVDFIQRASDKTREAKRAGKDTVRW